MIPSEKLKFYQENNIIEIAPLAYMRGRTLNNAFVLLDEAQNTTSMQMKMFLTRMGPNSKVIVTGDGSQVDLPRHHHSGLAEAVRLLRNVKGIATVELDTKDVVRHKLVKEIINAYDKPTKKVIRVKKIENQQELDEAFEIRREVFIVGQDCPEEEEFDDFDEEATHFIAYVKVNPLVRVGLEPPLKA